MKRVIPTGPVREHLGPALRAAREARRWSLAAAAEEITVNKMTLGSWERGDRTPSPDALWKLAQAYGMRVEELFPPQDDAPPRAQAQDLYEALEQLRALVDAAESAVAGVQP